MQNAATPLRPSPAVQTPSVEGLAPDERFRRYMEVYERTDGWFAKQSAAIWDSFLCFHEAQGVKGHLLEIGVHEGKSGSLLAAHKKQGEQLWGVDAWLRTEKIEAAFGSLRPMPDPSIHLLHETSYRLGVHRQLAPLQRQFRFVHIDGEHSGPAVHNDLDLAHTFLTGDGLVSVDDIFSASYPQLTDALFRYLHQHPDRFKLVLFGFNKAYLTRPMVAHDYRTFIDRALQDELDARGF
ncbi:MAG: class I SAM-dependent methyltransferase, partial [Planctomycetota bacterium]